MHVCASWSCVCMSVHVYACLCIVDAHAVHVCLHATLVCVHVYVCLHAMLDASGLGHGTPER